MARIMTWIVRYPFFSAAFAILLTLAFVPGLRSLSIDSSANGLLVPDDPDVLFYKDAKETFGDDVTLTIIIKAADVFQSDLLRAVERLSFAGEGIDGVTRVISLTTVGNLKGRDGVLDTDKLLPSIPEQPGELERIKMDALSNETLIGEVINATATTTAIHLNVESRPDDPDYDTRVCKAVESLIERERKVLGDGVEIYQCGSPYLKAEITSYIQRDAFILAPVSCFVVLLTLFIFFRSTLAVAIPIVTGALSVAATLGFMGYMGYAINPVSTIIPTLLMVCGCTEDIHLLAEYALGIRTKAEKNKAVLHMAVKSGTAIALTSVTTFVGFVTIAPNSIPILREFGIAASLGILLNFVLTITMVPSLVTWFPTPRSFLSEGKDPLGWIRGIVLGGVLGHRRLIAFSAAAVCAVSIYGSTRITVDTDYLNFFKTESEVRKVYRDVKENFVGLTNYFVVIDTGEENGVRDPGKLRSIEKLSDYLASRFGKQIGYVDFIRKLHVEMNDGNPEFRHVPDSGEVISQYSLMLNPDDMERFVDFENRRTCILVRCDVGGSVDTNAMVREVEGWIAANLPSDLKVRLTGEPLLVCSASDVISRELVKNLIYVFAAIFIVISILFGSLKAGLIAMIPNMIPVLTNFGLMGLLDIPLSTATFPVAIVALGIAVDDTIHLMVRYSKEVKETSDNTEAVANTVAKELRPIFTTSFALILGFGVLCLGQFGSVVQFGVLAALAMFSAFLSDLFVTPILLQRIPLFGAQGSGKHLPESVSEAFHNPSKPHNARPGDATGEPV